MAELKQILSIDTTQGVDNLLKLRTEIKELKSALETLEIGSKEYEETSDKLWAKQSRLNEIMKETKRPVEDAAGSYYALNKELVELRKTYRSLSEEDRNGAIGKQLLENIGKLDTQLKGLDADMGQYFRNVGNYSNSIVDAFGQMGISLTTLTRPLKEVGIDIKAVDTGIKLLQGSFKVFAKENLAALSDGFSKVSGSVGGFIKSLNGIKAAVLATGLGALVVLLGELVANWDSVSAAVERWIGINQTAILSADQINATLAQNSHEIDFNLRLMKARGESEEAMIDYQLAANKVEIERMRTIVEQSNALLENVKWWWERKRVIEQSDAAAEAVEKLEQERKRLLEDKEVLAALRKRQTEIEEERKKLQKNTAAVRDNTAAYTDMQREIDAAAAAAQREADKAIEEEERKLEKAEEVLQAEIDKRKTAEELEIEEYERKKAILEEYHLSTEELEANHWDRMNEIRFEREQKEYEELQRQRKIEKEQNDKQAADYKKQMNARKDATKYFVNSASDLFGKLSLAMGENTKMGKGFAIASATIDTIASAVAGFRAGYNQWKDTGYMSFMAPIQGAINATAALVAGYAQVQKIRSVDTSGNDSGGGGMATALAMPNIEGLSSPVDYTRQVTTETEQEEMNRSSRVYILESDIQESGNRVRIRENETTF